MMLEMLVEHRRTREAKAVFEHGLGEIDVTQLLAAPQPETITSIWVLTCSSASQRPRGSGADLARAA